VRVIRRFEVDLADIQKVKGRPTYTNKGVQMSESEWDAEPVKQDDSFWGGSLTDVKEIRQLIPPTKNVKLQIVGHMLFNTHDDGNERDWKQILIKFKIVDGIDVAGELKYKNSTLSQVLPYFANPAHYDYTKPFFAKGQFLVPLTQIAKATDIQTLTLIKGGLSDANAEQFGKAIENKMLIGSILQAKATVKNPETGEYVESGDLVNEVKFFKKVPDSALV